MEIGLMVASGGASTLTECRHHWKIAAPSGRTSMGRCKLCGAEREFLNFQSDFPYEGDSLSDNKFEASRVGAGSDDDGD